MKKTSSKILSLFLVVVLIAGTAFATVDTATVELKSFESGEVSSTLTNVLEVIVEDYVQGDDGNPEAIPTYRAESPAVVELTEDVGIFRVRKFNDDDLQKILAFEEYDFEAVEISGEVSFYDYETEEMITVDYSDLENYDHDEYTILTGAKATLTEDGMYLVWVQEPVISDFTWAVVIIGDADTAEEVEEDTTIKATPTASTVIIDGGENISFDAYNIGGNNYFKLRDLAYALNGTDKQFEIEWDGETKTITLTSGETYTEDGSEMKSKGTEVVSTVATASKIVLDGEELDLTAYNIGGNNYFKLRDIGKAFDFGISWEASTKTITIDTSAEYVEE